MSDILDKIVADKRVHVERRRGLVSDGQILMAAKAAPPVRKFANALRESVDKGQYGLIAEIKKASPSKGLIREDFDPPALARAYADGGAACLSVLTDRPYFQGADEFLRQARDAAGLPVLRKDFMIDLYQIAESRALGADCVLLIMAVLDDEQAYTLATAARGLGMDVLFEVHDVVEMERVLRLDPQLVGINNRNLKTFEVDLGTTEALAPLVPGSALVISESGLSSPQDLSRMSAAGVNCFLIGESLMRVDDVARATAGLLARVETTASSA
jgi:indole-3-glycerol phosphate synthase